MFQMGDFEFFLPGVRLTVAVVVVSSVFTRDDVVSQCLKFGSAFLSFSWESKISLFSNFPVSRAHPEKLCDFYWLQLQITCKSGWIAQAEKRYCVSKEGKSKLTS